MLLILGFACMTRASASDDSVRVGKPVRQGSSGIKQVDGSIIDRLDTVARDRVAGEEQVPATPEEWLARMLDPTRNGLILKRPKLFAEWLNAVTEPRFMTALATVAMDPNSYPRTFTRFLDPATARNWAELMDPEVFMRWVAAGMDPALYQAVYQHMTDPNKHMRWATYSAASTIADPIARAIRPNGQVGGDDQVGRAAAARAESWRYLPNDAALANPWLANRNTYRY